MVSNGGWNNDGFTDGEGKLKSDEAHTPAMDDGQAVAIASNQNANVHSVDGFALSSQSDTVRSSNARTRARKPTVADTFAQSSSMDFQESSEDGFQQGLRLQQDVNPSSTTSTMKTKKNHGRNVSWGVFPNEKQVHLPTKAPGAPFLAPQDDALPDDHGISSTEKRQQEQEQERQQQQSNGSNKEKIDLYDVINHAPAESESETMLFHSLESNTTAAEQQQHGANDQHGIFPNVPNEAIKHGFSLKRGLSFMPSFLVSQQAPADTARNARQQQHKRTLTLEEKLGGLADALDALHSLPEPMAADAMTARGDQYSVASNSAAGVRATEGLMANDDNDPEPTPALLTEADKLQRNAALLLSNRTAVNDGDENLSGGLPLSDSLPAVIASEVNQQLRESVKKGSSTVFSIDKDVENEESNDQMYANKDVDGGVTEQQQSVSHDETGNGEGPPPENKQADSTARQEGRGMKLKQNKLLQEFDGFIDQTSTSIRFYVRMAGQYIFFPSLGLASILFYFAENPPTGVWEDDDIVGSANAGNNATLTTAILNNAKGAVAPQATASVSWWLLFFGVRQLLTFSLSRLLEMFVIDFLSIRSQFCVRNFGPWVTLFIMQSRGWPFCIFCWAALDLVLLAGSHPFFSHWLYWQDYVGLFNESNPGGNIVNSEQNHRILVIAMSVGAVVAVKRFWIGIYLGRQTYGQFADRLASLMRKILIIGEVSYLGRTIRRQVQTFGIVRFTGGGLSEVKLADLLDNTATDGEGDDNTTLRSGMGDDPKVVVDPTDRDPLTLKLSNAQLTRIAQILGAWEEPLGPQESVSAASVTSILQFRRALSSLKTRYPFSSAFGLADSRENCIEAAQDVYRELMMRTPDAEVLKFDTLALLAVQEDGSIDQQKLEDMVRLFRPDRDGTSAMIDFVKSIDRVYRDLRLFNASVVNSSKIDNAFESIINVAFYTIVVTVILSQLGFDPLALFLSISGVILAFAFMIGTASAKYFEGLLFILVRRPYTIGDCVHISDVNNETSTSGSAWWTVEDMNLFTTKVNFLFTGERATLSNGSLADSRIINASRSPNANLSFRMKFALDVPFAKFKLLEQAAKEYVHRRPREWLSWKLFRPTAADQEKGYIEYIIGAKHRETWSNWGAIMNSKAQLTVFCVEASKELGITYHAPTVPIALQSTNVPLESLPFLQGMIPSAVPQTGHADENLVEKYGMRLLALHEKFAPTN